MFDKKNINEAYIDSYIQKLLSIAQQQNAVRLVKIAPENAYSATQKAAIIEFKNSSPKTFAIVIDPGASNDKNVYYLYALHPDGEVTESIEIYSASGLIDFVEFSHDPDDSVELNKGKVQSQKVTKKFVDLISLLRSKNILQAMG